jgi:hypothetical protein
MKKKEMILMVLATSTLLFSQGSILIHKSDHISVGASLAKVSNMSFGNNGTTVNLAVGNTSASYAMSDVDSISFSQASDTVYINYNKAYVAVINPLAFSGVAVTVNGGDVVVTAGEEVSAANYMLSGATTNGSFKIYSGKKFNLFLNGLSITNPNGPAINSQSHKKCTVTLMNGTTNALTDGSSYADSIVSISGETEDQKAAFCSEGSLAFAGGGKLTINGKGSVQHGLGSDDAIQIDEGTITVASAAKDGIHGNDGVVITGGTLNVSASSDAIDGGDGFVDIFGGTITTKSTVTDANGIACDSTITISGGTVNVTVNGDEGKGLHSGKSMKLLGGTIVIYTAGNTVLKTSGSGFDPSYCTAIKADSALYVDGANVTITSTGKGGKGLSSDNNMEISNGSIKITTSGAGTTYRNSSGVTDAYISTCLTSNANISIISGSITLSSSGAGGKGIHTDGALTIGDVYNAPQVSVTTTGAKITISGSGMNANYAEAKAISCDGLVTINSGTVTINSADDGIKSTSGITINNGTVAINNSTEGIEGPVITINNGTVNIVSSDDGFNATKGNGGEFNDGSYLYLKGGNVQINSSKGDGLDSNGNIVMSGGTVVVHGPSSQPEVGLDYNGTFIISGGLLMVSGPNSGNMIQASSTSSSQYAIKATMNTQLTSSTLFHIQDASGSNLVTFKPVRNVYYVVFSSPDLKSGATYYIYTGGSSTGTYANGLYVGGTYSGGTMKKSVVISGKVTSVSF